MVVLEQSTEIEGSPPPLEDSVDNTVLSGNTARPNRGIITFGWLSTTVAGYPPLLRFAVGAIAGVIYEGANVMLLHIFSFPNQRLLFLRGPLALALGAGIPRGLVTLLTPLFYR
jgi:hypothetical protein